MESQEPKQPNMLMGEFPKGASYEGRPGQTHAELIHYSCSCGAIFPFNVYRVVNVSTDRELAEAAVAGSLNHNQCPYCSRRAQVDIPYILHHPSEERFVLVVPEHQRHEELKLRSDALMKVAEATESLVPQYVADFEVVFSTEGLRSSLARPSKHIVLREDLAAVQQEHEERELRIAEVERLQTLRDAQLAEKERAVEKQEESVMMREERLKERGEKITRMEDDLRSQQARLEGLEIRFKVLEQRESDLNKREQALAARQQSMQEWEARLRAGEHQSGPPSSQPVGTSNELEAPQPQAQEPGTAGTNQDIVTSLMRDPEHDEIASETTQPSRSLAASPIPDGSISNGDEEAEELTDDDLIEEAEEITDDDLIEGETDLRAIPAEGKGSPKTPLPQAELSVPMIPGMEKAPPVAPPPSGIASRTPSGPTVTAVPGVVSPEPMELEPEPENQPVAKPYLDPPPHWIKSGDRTLHQVSGGEVYLYASVEPEIADKIKGDRSDLWVQLHLMPTYPVITMTLVLDTTQEDLEAIHWFVDIEEDSARTLLQVLRRRFQANVLLYDLEYALIDEVTFEPPREVNVAQVVDRTTQELGEIGPAKINPVQARMLFEGDWDWAGKKRHPFTEDAYAEINAVNEAKLALGILSYWSEPQNHEYLVLVKSVPVDLLDTITRRILDGAIRFGLWLPQPLKERAVALALAADLAALVARLIDALAALGPAPKGLELGDAAENWQRLLRDADELDIPVGKETAKLAESIIEKATSSEEREELDVEPTTLENIDDAPSEDLLTLLERRITRKKAALVLAERGNVDHLEALFRAARKMGRPDLVQVIPALLKYGESAGDYFIEGLTSRKSFTRQACAVALGELKLRRAVVPMLHQLMAEKTPVWYEIARALGRYGPSGIKPLHRYLRNPQGKEDRLVRAMASFAIHNAVKQVEELASGDDASVAMLAAQALDARDTLRKIDDQVQGKSEIEGADPLLRFSRRLYQAIAGEEHGDEDELLEELGESDIMEIDDGDEEKA